MFPQLAAGPIVRAAELLPQLDGSRDAGPRRATPAQLSEGGFLILWGLFKKTVIADNLATIVGLGFSLGPGVTTGAEFLVSIYAFAFQIYCDFSGYTDIARGLGKWLGLEFPRNFELPYLARNPRDFWRRWHITLSTWLRDYLYIPLGGNRRRVVGNLMLTMVLGGLWHGASWMFVFWGGFHGVLLVTHRWAAARIDERPQLRTFFAHRAVSIAQWVLFFHAVCFGWLLFRATSLAQVGWMLSGIVTRFGASSAYADLYRLVILVAPLLLMDAQRFRTRRPSWVLHIGAPARGLIYAAMTVGMMLFGRFYLEAFIYFRF